MTQPALDQMSLSSHEPFPTFVVKVGSGDEQQTFTACTELLRTSSAYFRAMLDNGFLEASTGEVVLDHAVDTPVAFEKILHYMSACALDGRPVYPFYTSFDILTDIKVFLMANRLCLYRLEGHALDKIRDHLCNSGLEEKYYSEKRLCKIVSLVWSYTMDSESASEMAYSDTRSSANALRRSLLVYCVCAKKYHKGNGFGKQLEKIDSFAEDFRRAMVRDAEGRL